MTEQCRQTGREPRHVRLLRKLGACEDGVRWAAGYPTAAAAWEACQSPEWMLWALDACGLYDEAKGRGVMAWCARNTPLPDGRTTWDLLTDERSRRAVELAERLAAGEQVDESARSAARSAAEAARSAARAAARAAQANQIRQCFGNPFRSRELLDRLAGE